MSTAMFVPATKVRPVGVKSGRALYYFGEYHSSARGPQGFMNESGPGSQIRPHFHHENQFQVFFGANGSTFQRQEIPKLLLHYSEAGTAYGPISSGDEGLDFFTLRQNGNEFTGYMPEDKGLLDPARRRRHLTADLASWLIEAGPARGETHVRDVFAPQDDPLRAYAISAGPGATIISPSPAEGMGQYLLVVDGELQHEGNTLGPRALGWCDPTDEAPVLLAGEQGVHYLVLQFSAPSTMAASLN